MDNTTRRRLAACLQARAMHVTGAIETATWEDLTRMDDALNDATDDDLEEWLDGLDWEALRVDIAATEREVYPDGVPPLSWEE